MLRNLNLYFAIFCSGAISLGAQDIYVLIHIEGIPYICPGGTVACTAFVPQEPIQDDYRFTWSTGDTAATVVLTEPGVYSVTVTDPAGNSGYKSFELAGGDFPLPVIDLTDTLFCIGDEERLALSLSAAYEIIRMETIPPVETLHHGDSLALRVELQLRGSTCAGELVVGGLYFYRDMPVPVIEEPAEAPALQPLVYRITELSPAHRYTWTITGGTIDWAAHGQIQVSWSDTAAVRRLCVYSELYDHACISEEACIETDLLSDTGITGTSRLPDLFPNPASDRLFLSGTTGATTLLVLTDCLGHTVYERTFHTDTDRVELDCSNWPGGIYLYRIGQTPGSFVSGKILILR